jgi:Flp pilus assembly secretin CpaC
MLLAAEPTASELYHRGRKAERAGQIVEAYLFYSEAAAKDPSHPEYQIRAQALQIRAALKAHAMPARDASGKMTIAPLEPVPGVAAAISEAELAELQRLRPPPTLQAAADRKSLDLHGDAKALFSQAAAAFGLGVAFDPEYQAGSQRRLHLDDADYREALRAVEAVTGSFAFPVGARLLMVVQDTQPKRVEYEPTIAVTVPIPETLTPQEAQEVGRAVQQTFDLSKLAVDTERREVLMRDRISRVRPAQELFEQLSHRRAQVMIEMQLLEVDRSSTLSYGLLLPSNFPISFLGTAGLASLHTGNSELAALASLLGNAIPLSQVAHLNPIMFGLGIANSQIFAAMTRSSADTLLDTSLRSLDGEAAQFHVGSKYPIMTGRLLNSAVAFSSITTATTTLTPTIASVQWTESAGNYTLVINGSGFGSPTVSLPFTGGVSNFAIEDQAQQAEWGYTGDALGLTFDSWTDSTVQISGFAAQPGDAVVISLWNSTSQTGGTWGGNIPTTATTPVIASVQLSGTGQGLQIVVQGSGFGAAPSTMPAAGAFGNLNYFRFWDFSGHCTPDAALFEAGFGSDTVTLGYQSWSDSEITISGFGGTYGQGCANYQAGDPIAIAILNSAATDATGPQTAWGGNTSFGSATSTATAGSAASTLANAPSFNFEDLGLVMKVTPHVHGTEEVSLEVSAEFKTLSGQSANGIPVIGSRKMESLVRLRDGEWAVIAGLMSVSDAKSIAGIPVLSRLPGIGTALRDNERNRVGEDVILMLRPILIDPPPDPSAAHPVWIGPEGRLAIPL